MQILLRQFALQARVCSGSKIKFRRVNIGSILNSALWGQRILKKQRLQFRRVFRFHFSSQDQAELFSP